MHVLFSALSDSKEEDAKVIAVLDDIKFFHCMPHILNVYFVSSPHAETRRYNHLYYTKHLGQIGIVSPRL